MSTFKKVAVGLVISVIAGLISAFMVINYQESKLKEDTFRILVREISVTKKTLEEFSKDDSITFPLADTQIPNSHWESLGVTEAKFINECDKKNIVSTFYQKLGQLSTWYSILKDMVASNSTPDEDLGKNINQAEIELLNLADKSIDVLNLCLENR